MSPSGTPAAGEQYPKKVTICHKTGSKKNPFVTIRVSRNALKAHMRHGDSLGPCSTAQFTVCHKGKKTTKVKGAKAAARHLRHGDKLGKCKKPKKDKSSERGKGSDKGKGNPDKPKGKPEKQKGKPEKGKPADKGKPAEAPGAPGDRGKKK